MTSNRYVLQRESGQGCLTRSPRSIPETGPRQVLLKVAAASLNYRDLLTLNDSNARDGLVPLSDAAGTVVAVGSGVTGWKVGDRACPNFFVDWIDGRFSLKYLGHALGGGSTDGVLSEFFVAEATSLVPVPEHLSFAEAATLPCAGLTAWHALFERGALEAGETVLVQGTGGVALFALQLATARGARVIVTSSSDEKLARAHRLGAWKTINYRASPDWDKVTLELTDGKGVDHILELGGPDTYERSVAAIAAGGHIAQIGVLTGFSASANIRPIQFKNAGINGICVGSVAQFRRFAAFLAEHQIHPIIDKDFGFSEASEAYAHLKAARHFGKVVIDLA